MKLQKSLVGLLSLLTLASCTSAGTTPPTAPSNDAPAPSPTSSAQPIAPTSAADSTRSQDVTYKSPAGDDVMTVSVTTKDGIITSASVTPKATNEISLKLQKAFADNVSAKVVGQPIKNLKVDTVSGASLTTAAFNGFLASAQ